MSARWQQIRAHAADVREHYRAELGAPLAFPLPAEELVEELYLLSAFEDPSLDERINGELDAGIGSIRLRPGMSPARRRFIIAHELGHYVLEDAGDLVFQDDDSTIDDRAGGELESGMGAARVYNTRERHEIEANFFALELLLPAEALWEEVQRPGWTVQSLAARFGVSTDAIYTQLVNACCIEPPAAVAEQAQPASALELDEHQRRAVAAPLPALVVAGPGTGKTRCIVARYVSLVEQGVDPASILALTFSNKAAEEMRARIIAALSAQYQERAGRVEISTFHAWGLNFLKSYGHLLDLPLDVQLRTPGDIYILLKRRLAELPLAEYKMLHDPGYYLMSIIGHISRIKDELRTPEEYRELAEREAERRVPAALLETEGKTTQKAQQKREKAERDAARLLELVAVYERYQALMREEGVIDFGDLIMRSVEALRVPEVAAEMHAQYQYILVDEFQDINYASGVLVQLLDGGRGRVWAVGDPWQSIYRFRGASPANLQEFTQVYPNAGVVPLVYNYRSVQPILDASLAIMEDDPEYVRRSAQESRSEHSVDGPPVVERVAENPHDECAAIAHDILRRTGARRARTVPCARPAGRLRSIRRPRAGCRRRRRQLRDHVVLCRSHRHARDVVAALETHGLPVEWVGDIFQYPEVKDTLALCAMVHSANSVGVLRALTVPEHALGERDLQTLTRLAHAEERSLQRALRDPEIVAQLSEEGRSCVLRLREIVDELEQEPDAWRVITRYLFDVSAAMRERLRRAARGEPGAYRELAMLGELIVLGKTFVRQSPEACDAGAFIEYVRLLIEAGEASRAPSYGEQADVVRVMTAHAAKGLEFPIVYVPCLEKDQFPSQKRGSSIPDLPELAHGDLGDELQEERYLLYVAMTRAQERLILSRAQSRGSRGGKRSPLLPGAEDGADAPWPVRQLPAARGCPPATPAARLQSAPLVRMPVPASSIETYERCPRRYLYQYGYQLYDDRSPFLRMHQCIREALQELTLGAQTGALPGSEEAVAARLWQIFAAHSMDEALYAEDYLAEARQHVLQLWRMLRHEDAAPDAVNAPFIIRRPAGRISVRVDQIEDGPDGPRWIRLRSGRRHEDDARSTQIMLYALAYREEYGEYPLIAIHYTARGETRPVSPRPKTLADHSVKIDAMLAGIAGGQWAPKVEQHCRTCLFNLICPV